MFSRLGTEFRRPGAAEPRIGQMLQRAAVIVVFIVSFSVLYIAMLLLGIGAFIIGRGSTRESRRFSTT
jgi:hypothetical protein